jgi:uncharacterized protein
MRYPREDTQPWYRQFWPWFVITPPLTGIALGVLLVTAATHDPDGMAVGDYYKEGRGINQSIERAQFALSLGLNGEVSIEEGRVWLKLASDVPIPRQELELAFVHPTRDHFDRRVPLTYDARREAYFTDLSDLDAALWHVYLEPADGSWRLRGRLDAIEDRAVTLHPST